MKRFALSLALFALLASIGCESKEAKLTELKAQYQPLYKQYFKDCLTLKTAGADAYFNGTGPLPIDPKQEAAHNEKCAQESKQVSALAQQMQSLQQ
jgi:hypothetical protein